MEIYPCNCSWEIPGVVKLPNHTHHYVTRWYNPTTDEEKIVSCHPKVGRPADTDWIPMQVDDEISIWVDYRAYSRALAGIFHP